MILKSIITLGLSVFASIAFTLLIRRLATVWSIVDSPKVDRWHTSPTPLLGGIGIAASVVISLLVLGRISFEYKVFLVGAALIFLEGLVDDFVRVRSFAKTLMLVIPALVPIFFGFYIEFIPIRWLAISITFFWIVGIANAFNYLDNMDGACAGTAAICGFMIYLYFLLRGTPGFAGFLGLALAGVSTSFLIFNFPPATIFMGDSGSLFLGYNLAICALIGDWQVPGGTLLFWITPLLIMAIPIFDTTLVTFQRFFHGISPFQGGRDHFSHRLVKAGFSEKEALAVIYVLGASLGLWGLIFSKVAFPFQIMLIVLAFLSLSSIGYFLTRLDVYGKTGIGRISVSASENPALKYHKIRAAITITTASTLLAAIITIIIIWV